MSISHFLRGPSLSYPKRFLLDALKVGRFFVQDVPRNVDDVAITAAILAMSRVNLY